VSAVQSLKQSELIFSKPLRGALGREEDFALLQRLILSPFLTSEQIALLEEQARLEEASLIEMAILSQYLPLDAFYFNMAKVLGCAFLKELPPDLSPLAAPMRWREVIETATLPVQDNRGNRYFWHAPEGKQLTQFIRRVFQNPKIAAEFILCTPRHFRHFTRLWARKQLGFEAINALKAKYPHFSANNSPLLKRSARLILVFIALLSLGLIVPSPLVLPFSGMASILFCGWLILRLGLSFFVPFSRPIKPLKTTELPLYSIIVPLYKEANIVPKLLSALSSINCPRSRLDIKIVVEPDDSETQSALNATTSNLFYEMIIAPSEGPRTKPKALMSAMPFVRGKYVVIYDAEDNPHPNQLREACATFHALGERSKVAVLQAPLIIENANRNVITRLFAAEYAALFDVTLPVLARYNLPLPLGGTSNHFKVSILRECGGWDPFNVTEDADLGLRFARLGYGAQTLRLGTFEEAPHRLSPWLNQRSRWFKGWLQTLTIHLSSPSALYKRLGFTRAMVSFLMLGSTFASALIHPIIYIYCLAGLFLEKETFPLELVAGFMGSSYCIAALILWLGARERKNINLRFSLLLLPLYWLMLSIAAWRALYELWKRPYFWAKTPHGEM
jgi:glycosyltransferase XagB